LYTLPVTYSLIDAPATCQLSTPSLHDALPICATVEPLRGPFAPGFAAEQNKSKGSHQRPLCPFWSTRSVGVPAHRIAPGRLGRRSEEHTSELQSRENLVCRLLLEKKNHASE